MAEVGSSQPKFDGYAEGYASLVDESVRASGESSEYFLEYKLNCLERLGIDPALPLLDYGCGVGSLTSVLSRRHTTLAGYDPSAKSLELARRAVPSATFHENAAQIPDESFGVAVLSGVLHHVPPAERVSVMQTVKRKLRPGGSVVIFEHNPWNPLTRRAIAACPFDDDAVLLWPLELRRLLRGVGFEGVRLDYIVFFPRPLARLRWLEPRLHWLFMGAQTMTVASRPSEVR